MEEPVRTVAFQVAEVPMVEPEIVKQIRTLSGYGWGAKRISRELGLARNTVRRYLRDPEAETQQRPKARRLDSEQRARAVALYGKEAEGNAVVVRDLLGVEASVRTVQRVLAPHRQEVRAAQVASVRFETAPGHQMQIDFGQKKVRIGGQLVRVYLLVAVLSFSRRLFVKPFLSERQEDWLEGVAEAFRHFGGVTRTLLGDNARALVADRDRETATVTFTPGYLAFCRDWEVEPRACAPYRARTKGKTESGVKYVKRNALAGREFESFAALRDHLVAWTVSADERVHGTTHERPRERFDREEREALRSLPARPLPARQRRLWRRVANDSMVDVDTVRYSVPHRLVRERVEVDVGTDQVRIFFGGQLCATHVRSLEPYAKVIDPAHYEGLLRMHRADQSAESPSALTALGRSLDVYAAIVQERGVA